MSPKKRARRARPSAKPSVAKLDLRVPVDAVEVTLAKPLSKPPVVTVTEKSILIQLRESAVGRFLLG